MIDSRLFGALAGTILVMTVSGCFGVDKDTRAEVDQKVSLEKPTKRSGELSDRGYEAWASSSAMSRDQKSKMNVIQASTERESVRIRNETSKTRSAMYKELATGEYDDRTIDGFKSKLVRLSQERLDVTFEALASARKTLGPSEDSKKYFEYMDAIDTADMDGHRF